MSQANPKMTTISI